MVRSSDPTENKEVNPVEAARPAGRPPDYQLPFGHKNDVFDYTPIRIDDHEPHWALVDNACSKTCINIKYARQLGLVIHPASAGAVYMGKKNIPRIGFVVLDLYNGEKCLKQINVEVIEHYTEPFIIGKDLFPTLNYTIANIPSKLPGPSTVRMEDLVPDPPPEITPTSFDSLHPELQAAISRNREINMVDTFCTHPLALLKIATTQAITEFTKRNYIKTQDQIDAVDKEFERYIVEGHMVPATEHPQACFAYLFFFYYQGFLLTNYSSSNKTLENPHFPVTP